MLLSAPYVNLKAVEALAKPKALAFARAPSSVAGFSWRIAEAGASPWAPAWVNALLHQAACQVLVVPSWCAVGMGGHGIRTRMMARTRIALHFLPVDHPHLWPVAITISYLQGHV